MRFCSEVKKRDARFGFDLEHFFSVFGEGEGEGISFFVIVSAHNGRDENGSDLSRRKCVYVSQKDFFVVIG